MNRLSSWFDRKTVNVNDTASTSSSITSEETLREKPRGLKGLFSRRPSQKGRSIPPSIIGRRHKSTASASVSEAEIAQIRQRTRSFATAQPSWVGRRRTAPPSAESELSQFNPFWDAESTGSTTSLSESMKLSNLNMRHVGALQTPTFDSVPVFMNASEVEIVDPFRRAPPMDRGVPNSFFMSLP